MESSVHKNRVASNAAAKIAGQKNSRIRHFRGISVAAKRRVLRYNIENR